jgi:CRISPR/Cas system CSM-associated protein Csm3 (group 7 of RAMP superfamily)
MIFLKAVLKAIQPLKIGGTESIPEYSNENGNTSKDNKEPDCYILRGGDNNPFIPGTTICGVCRHFFDDESDFGGLNKKSNYVFYDAEIQDGYTVSIRDNVAINSDGTAADGAKFDYEIIEAGAKFNLRIEYDGDIESLRKIIRAINCGDIVFGGKSTRGFGRMKIINPCILDIDIKTQIDEYINFKWENVKTPLDDINETESKNFYVCEIKFRIKSYLLIRGNPAKEERDGKEREFTKALTGISPEGEKENPIISGTAWAGVFRHHIVRMLKSANADNTDEIVKNLFGIADEKTGEKIKSKIRFETTFLKDTKTLKRTRTAVDRFTGGAGEGMLYTSNIVWGGGGVLRIFINKGNDEKAQKEFKLAKSLITACINEINAGYLTIGGEGGVGGGLLEMEEIKCR